MKGGIEEHSRAFTEQVSKRPDEFYDFILSLGRRDDIHISYLAAGIDGLVKADYNVVKIKELVKECWKNKDEEFRREIVRAIGYIDKKNTLDLDLISILEEYGLNDPDPVKESWMINAGNGTPYYLGDPFQHGINTVRGSAVEMLAIHGYKTSYPDKLFEIMENITNDHSVSVRCCLIRFLQGMLSWNREKTYDLFMKLTDYKHPQVIKYGLECLSFLITKDNFQDFIPHLKVAIGIDEGYGHHHVGEYVGQILMPAYVEEYPDSCNLLEEGFKVSDKIKAGAIGFAARRMLSKNKEISEKSKNIYLRFLNEDSEDISNKYEWSFEEFKPEDFDELYPLIEVYTKSRVARKDNSSFIWPFYKYLLKCVSFNPGRCIDLIYNHISLEQPLTQLGVLSLDERPVQILICAYNKLIDPAYKEKVMDIFDRILKDEAYKSEGLKVLAEHDRG